MKIFTNSQNKPIGGISRMMDTFIETVLKIEPSASFHFAVVASEKILDIGEHRISAGKQHGFPADNLFLSSDYYKEVVCRASSMEDLRSRLSDLIDFYTEGIEKSKPDIILINGTYYRPWALLQAARRTGIPYAVYVHGSVVKELQESSGRLLSLFKEMEADFYDNNASYLFPSNVALRGTMFSAQESRGRFHIVYNSLDQSFFTGKSQEGNGRNSIGFVLRWEKVKNTDFILEFIRFNENAVNPYDIEVVSDASAESLGLGPFQYAKFLPPKTKEEMIEFYRQTVAILNPSFFETFGYVPAEAAAAGTPAMISALQGISEVFLKCGLERLITDFSNVSAVHEKISDIIQKGISQKEIDRLQGELNPEILSRKILDVLYETAGLNSPINISRG